MVVVRRHTIGAQAHGNAAAQHLGNGRETAAELHVGSRVVGDERPVPLQDIQISVIHPHAMSRRHGHLEQPQAVEIGHRCEATVALAALAHFLLGLG